MFKNKFVRGVYGLRNDLGVHHEPVGFDGVFVVVFLNYFFGDVNVRVINLKMFKRGGSASIFNPLTYIIFHKKGTPFIYLYNPFYILQLVKSLPFHIT